MYCISLIHRRWGARVIIQFINSERHIINCKMICFGECVSAVMRVRIKKKKNTNNIHWVKCNEWKLLIYHSIKSYGFILNLSCCVSQCIWICSPKGVTDSQAQQYVCVVEFLYHIFQWLGTHLWSALDPINEMKQWSK